MVLRHTLKRMQVVSLVLVILGTMLLGAYPAAAGAIVDEPMEISSMQAYVDAMQPGWNLGNTFDAVGEDETAWGNPRVTRELIKQISAQGYKSIRIPITWDQHLGDGPEYEIEPAFLDRVEEVVNWSLHEGLYVMMNLHHDSWLWVNQLGSNHDQVLARYQAVWTQIADRFKNHSTKLMFESINEPNVSSLALLDELNTSFHRIVRDSGGNNSVRPLVLPTLYTSSDQEKLDALYSTILKLNDPNLIATIHYYGFWPFSVNIAGFTRFDDVTKNDIVQTFDRLHSSLIAKGIPVIIGEYGLLGFDQNTGTIEQGEKLKFFEFMLHYAQEKNLTHMLWDNGQHFNRRTMKWNDSELYDMMHASWKGRSSSAATDLIFVKQGEEVQDAVIPIQLNGNQMTALRVGGKVLRKGTDYEYSDQQLTIKASLLEQLTASGVLGENAVVVAQFNQGVDWSFKVLLVEKPVLQPTAGQTGSFAIPASFHGDQLATMEAVYADGGNAGPQNWTSFKEFSYTFFPSYGTNEIKLTQKFFDEVNDGVVILRFHFWSGEIVTYTLSKDGDQVVGSVS